MIDVPPRTVRMKRIILFFQVWFVPSDPYRSRVERILFEKLLPNPDSGKN
jgi:hypothetical protein